MFKKLCEVVVYLHELKIIHRDLKPDNVLFSTEEQNELKIIDFGLASFFHQDSSRGGSLPYMAPELLVNSHVYPDESHDIWSLGCILFEMVTGAKAFWGNKEDIILKIKEFAVSYPDYLSESLVSLLSLIFVEKEKRAQMKDIMSHRWLKTELVERKTKLKAALKTIKMDKLVVFRSDHKKKINLFREEMSSRSAKRTLTFNNKDQINFSKTLRNVETVRTTHKSPDLIGIRAKVDSSNDLRFAFLNGHMPSFTKPTGFTRETKRHLSKMQMFSTKKTFFVSTTLLPKISRSPEVSLGRNNTLNSMIGTMRKSFVK